MAGDWIWGDLFSGRILVFGGCEAPAFALHVPVDGGVGDDIFETFQFADDEGSMSPRTSI